MEQSNSYDGLSEDDLLISKESNQTVPIGVAISPDFASSEYCTPTHIVSQLDLLPPDVSNRQNASLSDLNSKQNQVFENRESQQFHVSNFQNRIFQTEHHTYQNVPLAESEAQSSPLTSTPPRFKSSATKESESTPLTCTPQTETSARGEAHFAHDTSTPQNESNTGNEAESTPVTSTTQNKSSGRTEAQTTPVTNTPQNETSERKEAQSTHVTSTQQTEISGRMEAQITPVTRSSQNAGKEDSTPSTPQNEICGRMESQCTRVKDTAQNETSAKKEAEFTHDTSKAQNEKSGRTEEVSTPQTNTPQNETSARDEAKSTHDASTLQNETSDRKSTPVTRSSQNAEKEESTPVKDTAQNETSARQSTHDASTPQNETSTHDASTPQNETSTPVTRSSQNAEKEESTPVTSTPQNEISTRDEAQSTHDASTPLNETSGRTKSQSTPVKDTAQNETSAKMEAEFTHDTSKAQNEKSGRTEEVPTPQTSTPQNETFARDEAKSTHYASTPQNERSGTKEAQTTPVTRSSQNAGKEEPTPVTSTPQNETSGRTQTQSTPVKDTAQNEKSGIKDVHVASYTSLTTTSQNETSAKKEAEFTHDTSKAQNETSGRTEAEFIPLTSTPQTEISAGKEAEFAHEACTPQNEVSVGKEVQSTPVTSSVQNAGKEPQSTPLISTPQNETSGRMAAESSALPKNPQHEPSEDASLQDKHIVVALPSKGDETNQPRGVVKPCGLDNLGNTCYMNAALQGLGSVADLKDYFLYGSQQTAPPIALELSNMIHVMWSESHQMTFRPDKIKREVGRCNERFSHNTQEDSQEFLITLLGMLHDGVKRMPYTCTEAEVKWSEYLSTHGRSVVSDVFEGQLQSSMKCGECKQLVCKFDPFMFLSLPIPNEKHSYTLTLDNCLASLFKEEYYDGKCWCCCKCGQRADMERNLKISRLPNTLMIYLKRFQHDMYGRRSKVNTFVEFPLKDLDISCYTSNTNQNGIYNLIAVICHSGSIDGGHYTAFGSRDNQWYRFNDQQVQKCSDDNIVCQEAYVLFYQEGSKQNIQVRATQEIRVHELTVEVEHLREENARLDEKVKILQEENKMMNKNKVKQPPKRKDKQEHQRASKSPDQHNWMKWCCCC